MSLPPSPPAAASQAYVRAPRPIGKRLLHLTRTLHTYVTMLALILLIFFSFTGFILNNALSSDGRGKLFNLNIDETTPVTRAGKIPRGILAGNEHLFAIEQYLRKNLDARGEIAANPDESDADIIRFQFQGPGRKTDVEINKQSGETKIEERRGLLATLGDLHMGKHVGAVWAWFIDATAIFLFFAAVSGLILWISLPKRRTLGIVALVVSVVACLAVYLWLVP